MLTYTHDSCIVQAYTQNVSKGDDNLNEMDSKIIGNRLVNLRGKRTQEEVAKATKISDSALSMYERGERIPRDNIKIRLASYYGQPIYDIFYA